MTRTRTVMRALGVALLCTLMAAVTASIRPAPAAAGHPSDSPPDTLVMAAIQAAQFTAVDGAKGDRFGRAVAVSGDTVLVGATGADGTPGAAYVFVRSGASWSFQQKLTAGDGQGGDWFGHSVAVWGDTALVGAVYDDVGATSVNQGSAYVYTRSGTTWSQQQRLTADDGAAGDDFGWSVALSGDTALIGAFGAHAYQGSAYVFARSGTSWTQQKQLAADDPGPVHGFGCSVALSGDTALVGASGDDVGTDKGQGAAYVFTRSGTTWSQQQRLTAADGTTDDWFGRAVALDGDTALVGMHGDDAGAAGNRGSAYVYTRSGTIWSQQQQLTASDGAADDQFGWSVALSGDAAVVGAPSHSVGANTDQGSAYVYTRSGTIWSQQQQLTASDGSAADQFGWSVGFSRETALAGACFDDVGASEDQGSACLFSHVDYVAPSTTASLGPSANAAGWCKRPVKVTLSAADALSGIDKSYYRLGSGGAFSVYDGAARPRIAAQGVTIVGYYSTDVAGNAEAAKSITVRVDSSKPRTRAFAATARKGRKVKLVCRVNDARPGCGRAAVTFKISTAAKRPKLVRTIRLAGSQACNARITYTWRCALKRGAYVLKVFATDIAGNAQRKAGSALLTVW
jgi:hypothetical protein